MFIFICSKDILGFSSHYYFVAYDACLFLSSGSVLPTLDPPQQYLQIEQSSNSSTFIFQGYPSKSQSSSWDFLSRAPIGMTFIFQRLLQSPAPQYFPPCLRFWCISIGSSPRIYCQYQNVSSVWTPPACWISLPKILPRWHCHVISSEGRPRTSVVFLISSLVLIWHSQYWQAYP